MPNLNARSGAGAEDGGVITEHSDGQIVGVAGAELATPTAGPDAARRHKLATFLTGRGPVIALVAACVVFGLINPTFLSVANLQTILDLSAIPLILCVGMTFVVLMGQMDLSLEGVMAASGLSFVLLSVNNINDNRGGPLAIIVPMLIALLLGLVNILVHNLLRVPTFMTSLGVWFVGLGIATILFGEMQPQLRDPGMLSWVSERPLGISNAFAIAVCFVLAAIWLQSHTTFGRGAYAIGEDEGISRLLSIPVKKFKLIAYLLSAFCAGVAGILGSMRVGVGTVGVGNGQLFFTVAAVVVGGTALSGGRGGIIQSIIGVLLLTVINDGLVLSGVSPNVQQAIAGIIIVVAVVATDVRRRRILRVVK